MSTEKNFNYKGLGCFLQDGYQALRVAVNTLMLQPQSVPKVEATFFMD